MATPDASAALASVWLMTFALAAAAVPALVLDDEAVLQLLRQQASVCMR